MFLENNKNEKASVFTEAFSMVGLRTQKLNHLQEIAGLIGTKNQNIKDLKLVNKPKHMKDVDEFRIFENINPILPYIVTNY